MTQIVTVQAGGGAPGNAPNALILPGQPAPPGRGVVSVALSADGTNFVFTFNSPPLTATVPVPNVGLAPSPAEILAAVAGQPLSAATASPDGGRTFITLAQTALAAENALQPSAAGTTLAPLVNGKIPLSLLPPSVIGAQHYLGAWNASSNLPALASSTAPVDGLVGGYYVCSTAGTTSIDSCSIWAMGDWIVWDGTRWDKLDGQVNPVTMVAGLQGAVTAPALKAALQIAAGDVAGLGTAAVANIGNTTGTVADGGVLAAEAGTRAAGDASNTSAIGVLAAQLNAAASLAASAIQPATLLAASVINLASAIKAQITGGNVIAGLNNSVQDFSKQLLTPSASAASLPMPPIIGRVPHIDNFYAGTFAAASAAGSFDVAFAKMLSDYVRTGKKLLIGPHAYLLANTLTLPAGTVIEGDAGHAGWLYSGNMLAPAITRPYSLLLTPGAPLGAGNNPALMAGSLVLNDGCAIKHLNIISYPTALLAGTAITGVCQEQAIFNQMQQASGGVGVASLGNDVRVDNVSLDGFNRNFFHGNAKSATGTAGNRPALIDVRSHGWINFHLQGVKDCARYSGHVFPNAFAPTTNTAPDNSWTVTIASDGANGSDLTITGGPTITGQVDGAIITILLQTAVAATPAYSTSNNNLNRFGDNAGNNSPVSAFTAAAVWRLRTGGVWVINLPTCAPSSFPTAPATLSFEACSGMGIGMFLDGAGATPVSDFTSVRAQVQLYVLNSPDVTFKGCLFDSNVAIADMTSHSAWFDGTSTGCRLLGGYSHAAFYGITETCPVTNRGANQAPFIRVDQHDVSDQPVGASFLNSANGAVCFSAVDAQSVGNPGNIIMNPTGQDIMLTGGCTFGTQGFTVNGQSTTTPPCLLVTPGNINTPAWVTKYTG